MLWSRIDEHVGGVLWPSGRLVTDSDKHTTIGFEVAGGYRFADLRTLLVARYQVLFADQAEDLILGEGEDALLAEHADWALERIRTRGGA